MRALASKTVNTDPSRFKHKVTGERLDNWEAELLFIDDAYLDEFIEAPRPEFDNNLNPILAAYRKLGPQLFGGVHGWLKYAMHGRSCDGVPITPDHITHARKVLTRLAAMEDGHAE